MPDTATYQDEHGRLEQCAHCRRMHHRHEETRWDWVPEWVEQILPGTRHTLCSGCFEFYYPTATGRN